MHANDLGNKAIVSVFFDLSDTPSIFLTTLNFKTIKGKLSAPGSFPLGGTADLDLTISNSSNFIIYDGSMPRPPCEPDTKIFLLADTKKISAEQIAAFPAQLQNYHRQSHSREHRPITVTFSGEQQSA